MSAFLCSEYHINTIVAAIDGDAGDFILMVNENLRSLEARYPGRPFLKEWKQEAGTYRFRGARSTVSATQLLKACNCYDYQACETDDYETTDAAAFVKRVREYALAQGAKENGPEYDAAGWEL